MAGDESFSRALRNINNHGDTDIFPYPIENFVFYDHKTEIIELLRKMAGDIDAFLVSDPPANANALAPVSYTGFRWATQIDPIWNAFLLGNVISIAENIEKARISISRNIVFSYRYCWNNDTGDLFNPEFGWTSFMKQSNKLCEENKFVVTCDISEFYARINHHRLENSLRQLRVPGNEPGHIMKFLSNFSDTYSFGMPVGGPAARILAELLLNQVDQLLDVNGVRFCRFADDYHIFAESYEAALTALVFLSEKLLQNQGLQLQKAKTRIMTAAEFLSTSPLQSEEHHEEDREKTELSRRAHDLMRFSIRFDPYMANSQDRYEALKSEIQRINIIELLKAELVKSRVHIALTRRIVNALKFVEADFRDEAVISLIDNHDLLFPIFSNVLLVVKNLFEQLEPETQDYILDKIRSLIQTGSHVFAVELNLAYAIRLLSCKQSASSGELLNTIYRQSKSSLLRRDIIIAMARWQSWYWLSDIKTSFRTLGPLERRAFIVSSFNLSDEGRHWRSHLKSEFNDLERIMERWASQKQGLADWNLPL